MKPEKLLILLIIFFMVGCATTRLKMDVPISDEPKESAGTYVFYSTGTSADKINKYTDTGSSLADKLAQNWGYIELDMDMWVYPDNSTVDWNDTTKYPDSWTSGFKRSDGDKNTILLEEFSYPLPMLLDQAIDDTGRVKVHGGVTASVDSSPDDFQLYWDTTLMKFSIYDEDTWRTITSVGGTGEVTEILTDYSGASGADDTITFATETFINIEASATYDRITFTANVKDEDAMTSNSASYLATQQSIKAYVDGMHPSLKMVRLRLASGVLGTQMIICCRCW